MNKFDENVLIKQLIKESQKGKSLQQLSKKYNIEKTKLCKLLNSYNLSDIKKQTIIVLRQTGYRHSIIAQRLSITTETVKEVLRSFNMEHRLKNAGLSKQEILSTRAKLERG